METHKQFAGGLKTVDTDDSLNSFYLRDAENISLSEFGYLERRYGLVNDYNFDFLAVDIDPDTEDFETKYRLQGYFEYLRKNGKKDQIIIFNGYLYLNGSRIDDLYIYPEDEIGPTISINQFKELTGKDTIEEATAPTGVNYFTKIGALFNHGREIEATRLEDRLFIFTGVYPIIYEGTGEFFLMPEHRTTFAEVRASGHDLHTYDLENIYNRFDTPDPIVNQSDVVPLFSEPTFNPFLPYNITQSDGSDTGLNLRVQYRLPDPATLYNVNSFTGFTTSGSVNPGESYNDQGIITPGAGLYVQLVPKVYYRASGLSSEDLAWIQIDDAQLEYKVVNNINSDVPNNNTAIFDVSANDAGLVFNNLNVSKSVRGQAFALSNNSTVYSLKLLNVPIGYNDYLIQFNFEKYGYGVVDNLEGNPAFINGEVFYSSSVTLESVFASNIPVEDYKEFEAKALWSCNKVLNHYGKLMAYGSTEIPQRLFIGHPTYKNYFPSYFTLDFETDDEQIIQQITPFMNILVVQSESFTWGLKGIDALIESDNTYTPFTISPIYGTIAPKSVRPVRNQLYFLSKEGVVSLQSLYAIDDQYNVKRMDENIENIVPQDPEAVAIQYDNQYWINFPNTDNGLTLRYDVDLRAWMKDTYFEYNGLNEQNKPVLSSTIFNGVFKYIREGENLVLVTNPMQLAARDFNDGFDVNNFKIYRLYVDYAIPTDLGETPRTLFETSFLNQGYPFHTKKYLEEKMEFTIQNEYNKGLEPIYINRDFSTKAILNEPSTNPFTIENIALEKNHTYKINSPGTIKQINVRLFDIQGNPIDTLNYREFQPTRPNIFNLIATVNGNVSFDVFNNHPGNNLIYYELDDGFEYTLDDGTTQRFLGTVTVNSFQQRTVNLTNVPAGVHFIKAVTYFQSLSGPVSDERIVNFFVPDALYAEDQLQDPTTDVDAPVEFIVTTTTGNYFNPETEETETYADGFNLSWADPNPPVAGTTYEYAWRFTGASVWNTAPATPDKTATIQFSEADVLQYQNTQFDFRVRVRWNGIYSSYTTAGPVRLLRPTQPPATLGAVSSVKLSDRLKFGWQDIVGEELYRVYWRYVGPESYSTLAEYPELRRDALGQDVEEFLLDPLDNYTQIPDIFTNAVVEARVIPVNSINQDSINVTSGSKRDGVFTNPYAIANITKTAINDVAGFRLRVNDAKKPFGNSFYVFEDYWDVQFRIAPDDTNLSLTQVDSTSPNEPNSPSTGFIWAKEIGDGELEYYSYTGSAWDLRGKRVKVTKKTYTSAENVNIDVTGLDPTTTYNVELRGVYTLNGAVMNYSGVVGIPLVWSQRFQATTGTFNAGPTANPTELSFSSSDTSSITFTYKQNHSTNANIYYAYSTGNLGSIDPENVNTYNAVKFNVSLGTDTIKISGLSAGTSYNIAIKADTEINDPSSQLNAVFSTTTAPAPPPDPDPEPEPEPEPEPDPVPAAPASASITTFTTNQVTFTWSSVTGATSYQYTYYLNGSAAESGVCTLPSQSITVPAGQIFVRVVACNSSGCSTGYAQTQTVTVSGVGLG